MTGGSYYDVLGVREDADAEVIDAAYRALMKKYHPDAKASGQRDRAAEINEAYAVLRDPWKRSAYDQELRRQRGEPGTALKPRVPHDQRQQQRRDESTPPANDKKECPDCGEWVPRSARVCRYCGFEFFGGRREPRQLEAAAPPPRRSGLGLLIAVIAVVLLLGLLGLGSVEPVDVETGSSAAETGDGVAGEASPAADPAAEAQMEQAQLPLGPPAVSLLLHDGNPHACAAPQVRETIAEAILDPLGAALGEAGTGTVRSQYTVGLSELSQTGIDRETSQMACSANARITTPLGTETHTIDYVLRPALEPDHDFIVSGNWGAAQTLVMEVAMFGRFLNATQAPPVENGSE